MKNLEKKFQKIEMSKMHNALISNKPIFIYFTSFSFEEKLYDAVEKLIKKVPIVYMDSKYSKPILKTYEIREIPTIALFHDEKMVGSFSSKYPEKVKDWLETNGIKYLLEQYYGNKKRARNS